MELGVCFREQLFGIGGEVLPNEFEQMAERIQRAWLREHTENDGHGDVTASSIVVTGKVVTSGSQIFQLTGAANHNLPLGEGVAIMVVVPSGAVSITGFANGVTGRRFVLINGAASVDAITLLLDDVGSVPTNRIASDLSIFPDTIVIQPGRAVELIYYEDGGPNGGTFVNPRWRVMVKA